MVKRVSLQQMKQNLQDKSGGKSNIWNPMDNLELNGSAKIRFLPYEDEVTGGFWSVAKTLTAYFVNPDNEKETWRAYIPCLETYQAQIDGMCPVANLVREVYEEARTCKNKGDKEGHDTYSEVGGRHWMKYKTFYQGFVEGGNTEVDSEKIVPITFPKSAADIVRETVFGRESSFDTLPTGEFILDDIKDFSETGKAPEDMNEEQFIESLTGRRFIVKKVKQGDHNNYKTSQWELKEHTLSDGQIAAIADNGFINLRNFLPKRPTDEQYAVYEEMMRISIAAALGSKEISNVWNPEWETKYKILPFKGKSDENQKSSGSSFRGKSFNNEEEDGDEDSEEIQPSSKPKVTSADILKKLRNNKGAKAEEDEESSDSAEEPETQEETEVADNSGEARKTNVKNLHSLLKKKIEEEQE